MNRQEAVQHAASGVGVLLGADLDFQQPEEFPCDECGAIVDLRSLIDVCITPVDDEGETVVQMSEANARALLVTVGIPPPPVICSKHDNIGEVLTEAL